MTISSILYSYSSHYSTFLVIGNKFCGSSSYICSMILCYLLYFLRILLYFSSPSWWSPFIHLYFGGTVFGVSFSYFRCDGMSITIILWSPTVTLKVKYYSLLVHISQIPQTASIHFVPHVDVFSAGSSVYFSFVGSMIPIPYASSDLFRWMPAMSVIPSIVRRRYPNGVSTPIILSEVLFIYYEGAYFFPCWSHKGSLFLVYCAIWPGISPLIWSIRYDYPQIQYCPTAIHYPIPYS